MYSSQTLRLIVVVIALHYIQLSKVNEF